MGFASDFHAKDFFAAKKPPYSLLTKEQRSKFIQTVTEAANAPRINPLGAAVQVEAFNALSYGERRFLTGGIRAGHRFWTSGSPSRPWFLAFQFCIRQAAKLTKPGKTVNFIFDQQKEFASLALAQFAEMKQMMLGPSERKKLGGCYFKPRGEFPALYLVDLLAHCGKAYAEGEGKESERIYALERLLIDKGEDIVLFNSSGLEKTLSHLPEDKREILRADIGPSRRKGKD
ncbi:MAG TPA: hypothetical protein VNM67_22175 [Thermoanaerobaculia bacterium]|nr:hypothetical protein [Thermoanaerobaculia bacterium]